MQLSARNQLSGSMVSITQARRSSRLISVFSDALRQPRFTGRWRVTALPGKWRVGVG
jgi:hypothetical protein